MTVEELIEKLKEMPQDKKIFFYEDAKYPLDINFVFTDEDGDVGISYEEI